MKNSILLIETSTARCSVALAVGREIVSYRETEVPKAHASMLCPFIDEMLSECSLPFAGIDAVAVSGGPGSYTGLRVGVSTAKGLCFGGGKPLVSVGTLEVLAWQALGKGLVRADDIIIPMVDARRMEVYAQLFSPDGSALSECTAEILDSDSFTSGFLRVGRLVFIGDGVEKYRHFLEENHPERMSACLFVEECPDARAMVMPASRKFENGLFESSAYYEPFYLKEFVAGISKKSVL